MCRMRGVRCKIFGGGHPPLSRSGIAGISGNPPDFPINAHLHRRLLQVAALTTNSVGRGDYRGKMHLRQLGNRE